jgi:hypothetical protein
MLSKSDFFINKNILLELDKNRTFLCSDNDKVLYNIPEEYYKIDLLNIKEFCVYTGGLDFISFPLSHLKSIKFYIEKGRFLYQEIKMLIDVKCLLHNISILTLETFHFPTVITMQQEYNIILEKLKQLMVKIRKQIVFSLKNSFLCKMFPNYLETLIEVYFEYSETGINIAELSIFLADITQMNYLLTEKEKIAHQTLLDASQNVKYPLLTRKHLSYRFFYFLCSVGELKYFPKDETILNRFFYSD